MRGLLSHPRIYSLFRRLVGRDSARAVYVREHLRLAPGQRVLDLGCGPGDIVQFLPEVKYVGYDVSPAYIERARRRFGHRASFHCAAVDDALSPGTGFDVVIAHGVLHHLDDAEALRLLRTARRALAPGGRLVTFDGCYADEQRALARLFLWLDRGRHVRDRQGYERLARAEFAHVRSVLRDDLIRLPYTHLIMECTRDG